MGGTFDPIHYGHLLAAEECRRQLGLDRVVFVPSGIPPHKDGSVASSEDRYAMTLLATAEVREFSVSRTEIDRPRPSHTVDTLEEFLRDCPAESEFFFITGLDALLGIDTWKEYARLPSLCTLVSTTRPGYSAPDVDSLPDGIRLGLKLLEIPRLDISSTDIRSRVRDGKGIRFLVPHLVEKYIEHCGLYREPEVSRN
ncbi:MAG: nicotinate-nucleotide adenylyltransferase [Synergistaceae bacterium]|nr:nicotinate-nucleotide adenylyltransferase [Synergistaceae bacterium]